MSALPVQENEKRPKEGPSNPRLRNGARLRILPVPATDPPPVDPHKRRSRSPSPQQAMLDLAMDSPAAFTPADPARTPAPATPETLPDPTRTVATLAPAVMEVLNGVRPAAQLIRWTSQDVQSALAQRAAIAARMGRQTRPGRPPVVRAVQVCRPTETIAEASAVVVDADRVRAVAIRLEATDNRWRATALEVG